MGITGAIEDALVKEGIVLHPGSMKHIKPKGE